MRRLYWRPKQIPRPALLALLVASLGLTALVELAGRRASDPYLGEMLAATRAAQEGFDAIKQERQRRGLQLQPSLDPTGSGLIGFQDTATTSVHGSLPSKQTSINPNWAAAFVYEFRRAGVEPGDAVAVGLSGSFPALNLSTLVALEAIGARPLVICSTAASQYGANHPSLLWPTMAHVLRRDGVLETTALGASLGGEDDVAASLGPEGRAALERAIAEAGIDRIGKPRPDQPSSEARTANIRERIAIYEAARGDQPIKLYVNVGGSTVSIGRGRARRAFKPGLSDGVSPSPNLPKLASVAAFYADQGTPIMNVTHITDLAAQYGLPLTPHTLPPVGTGGVYTKQIYDRRLAVGSLAVIAFLLALCTRFGHFVSLFGGRPEPDVSIEATI